MSSSTLTVHRQRHVHKRKTSFTITSPTSSSSPNHPRIKPKLISRQNPIHQLNLCPKLVLPPISSCKIHELPTLDDLLASFKFLKSICDHGNIKVVAGKWKESDHCICKIFNIYDKSSRAMQCRIDNVWREYQLVRYCGLMEYGKLYYDASTYSLIIRQLCYRQTLFEYIVRRRPLHKKEHIAKRIVMDVLKKLWLLHNSQFVHRDIKPDNIMERRLDSKIDSDWMSDGWLLIDYSDARKVGFQAGFAGTIGYTAPEIDFNSKQNVYTFASDIFSFGLVILFIMTGHQPLELPRSEMKKYNEPSVCDKRGMIRKQVHSNWYYGHVVNGEKQMKRHLMNLLFDERISYPLFKLLFEGMLSYNPKKRWSCKQIYHSEWLKGMDV